MFQKKLASAYGWLTLFVWLLMALGGLVRAMNAGLACPDWPLCFGDIIPDYHPQVYFEFIHRVVAGLVSLASVTLAILAFKSGQLSVRLRWVVGSSLALLLAQVIFGGLTVILKLKESVVTTHLALGTLFFSTNLYVFLNLSNRKKLQAQSVVVVRFLHICLGLVFAQILLGGLVASHYAALLCTDFPTCNGKFIPTLSGTLGLHVWHRLGAYTVGLAIFCLLGLVYKFEKDPQIRKNILHIFLIVLLQIGIGISNVLLMTPPLITVLHLANGVVLLGLLLKSVVEIRIMKVQKFL